MSLYSTGQRFARHKVDLIHETFGSGCELFHYLCEEYRYHCAAYFLLVVAYASPHFMTMVFHAGQYVMGFQMVRNTCGIVIVSGTLSVLVFCRSIAQFCLLWAQNAASDYLAANGAKTDEPKTPQDLIRDLGIPIGNDQDLKCMGSAQKHDTAAESDLILLNSEDLSADMLSPCGDSTCADAPLATEDRLCSTNPFCNAGMPTQILSAPDLVPRRAKNICHLALPSVSPEAEKPTECIMSSSPEQSACQPPLPAPLVTKPHAGWVTFDSPSSSEGKFRSKHRVKPCESAVSSSFGDADSELPMEDLRITYIRYESPCPDSISTLSDHVDLISNHSVMSSSSICSAGICPEMLEKDMHPDRSSGPDEEDQKASATARSRLPMPSLSAEDHRAQFLGKARFAMDLDLAHGILQKSPGPSIRQSWLGTFMVKQALWWYRCNVILHDGSLEIHILKPEGRVKRIFQYGVSLLKMESLLSFKCSVRGGSRRVKISAPQKPSIWLRAQSYAHKKEFVNSVEEAQRKNLNALAGFSKSL